MFIDFQNIENARDLGGIAVSGGKHIKTGLLLRTAKLETATGADISRLAEEYAVKYILDFRDPSELEAHPDREVPGAQHLAIPVLPQLPEAEGQVIVTDPMVVFNRIYREFAVEERPVSAYRTFFDILLRGEGAVLWHCTQGKDRTGIAAILLLTALGADWTDIERDYFLTNEFMQPIYDAYAAKHTSEQERDIAKKFLFVMPECLKIFTSLVEESYGGIMGYLKEKIKLTDAEIGQLRDLYTQ